eukprot:355265-Chlamydomonas_euryale.AAC.7
MHQRYRILTCVFTALLLAVVHPAAPAKKLSRAARSNTSSVLIQECTHITLSEHITAAALLLLGPLELENDQAGQGSVFTYDALCPSPLGAPPPIPRRHRHHHQHLRTVNNY